MLPQLIINTNLQVRIDYINQAIAELNLNPNHQDLLYFKEDKIGIEVAKMIKDHFAYKPQQSKGKAVVIENADKITPESQNALLKTIEELPKHSLFIISASSNSIFLPTLLSRCQVIQLTQLNQNLDENELLQIDKLFNMNTEERFCFIEKTKDREELFSWIIAYVEYNLQNCSREELVKIKPYLDKLLTAERWSKSNVNIRGILEYLMLEIP